MNSAKFWIRTIWTIIISLYTTKRKITKININTVQLFFKETGGYYKITIYPDASIEFSKKKSFKATVE